MKNWIWRYFLRFIYLKVKSYLSKIGIRIDVSRAPVIPKSMYGAKFDENYLRKIINIISQITAVMPKNLIEVGANLGQDSAFLSYMWRITDDNVVAVEPIPEYAKRIKDKYKFRVIEAEISEEQGRAWLNLQDSVSNNLGTASLHSHPTNDKSRIEVQTKRLDAILNEMFFASLDFLKIDAEGHTFEVLKSLGERVTDVKIIQIETEYLPVWDSSVKQETIFKFLEKYHFVLVDYGMGEDGLQADSLWIRNDLIIRKVYDLSTGEFRPYLGSK